MEGASWWNQALKQPISFQVKILPEDDPTFAIT
jgi:hypothetical protein